MLIKIGDVRYNWRNVETFRAEGDTKIAVRTLSEIRTFKFKDKITRDNALASLDEAILNNGSCDIKVD